MHAQVLVERHADDHHAAGGKVADQGDAGEGAGGEALVAVDDVEVAADEDAEDAVAEEDGGGERGPDADVRVSGPAWFFTVVSLGVKGQKRGEQRVGATKIRTHPKQTYRNGNGPAEHGEPEAIFRREL